MDNINYKPATIHVAGLHSSTPGHIRIIWYYRPDSTKRLQRYRKNFELNRIADEKARMQAAELIVKAINEILKTGNDPLAILDPEQSTTKPHTTLLEALKNAHKKKLSRITKKRTIGSYNSLYNSFISYIESHKMKSLLIGDFTRIHASNYQDFCIGLGSAPKTINIKVQFASELFDELDRVGLIPFNPFNKIRHLPEKSQAVQVFTIEELTTIKEHLYINGTFPELWIFSMFVYYAYMRPESIVNIKRSHIDFSNGIIFIPGETHKNGQPVKKELLPQHAKYLERYIHLSPETYLFSKKLLPGNVLIAPTRAAEFWAEHVQDALGIRKIMYLMKDTGSTQYLENNKGKENLKWLQMQMAHADLQTTSIYTNKVTFVRLGDTDSIVDL